LIAHIERAAVSSEFLDPASPKRLIARLRRMFSRAGPEKEEVAILRGLFAALEIRNQGSGIRGQMPVDRREGAQENPSCSSLATKVPKAR
jgi:tRNA C32,U32 (ribose-2'-O)-methylase TrmJ